MPRTADHHKLNVTSSGDGCVTKSFRLADRYQGVAVAVEDQSWWEIAGDMVQWREFAGGLALAVHVDWPLIKRSPKVAGWAAVAGILRGASQVGQVGYRAEDNCGLYT